MSNNVYVFYHIFCREMTLDIIKSQTDHIMFSGLYDTVNAIYCFITGEPEHMSKCIEYINTLGQKYKITYTIPNDTTYERFTLLKIRNFVKSGDKFLYIHSKGVRLPDSSPIKYWRMYLEYYCMTKHKQCLQDLDNHDIVGVNWRSIPKPHYSGNFWWSTADYYLKLPDIIGPEYCDPEFYIGMNNPNHLSYRDVIYHTYDENTYPSFYIDDI